MAEVQRFITVALAAVALGLLQNSIESRIDSGLYQRLVTLVLSSWIFVLALREYRTSQ